MTLVKERFSMSEAMRIAVLIDSDNISAKYISAVLDEVSVYGMASIRRIYGDWTSPYSVKWKDQLLENSLTPMQQFSNTSGKNSTDSAMIIDAMDILYSGDIDGFCIVSSDSDFTRLASRLRESGHLVIGMGEEKTPLPFRKACTKFIALENLVKDDDEPLAQENVLKVEKVEEAIFATVVSNDGIGKRTRLSGIGNELGNKYSDFDVRNYGYSSLSRFVGDLERFNLQREDNDYFVSLNDRVGCEEAVAELIYSKVLKAQNESISLSELGNAVRDTFPDFDPRNYGYAQFSKFVESIDNVALVRNDNGQMFASSI